MKYFLILVCTIFLAMMPISVMAKNSDKGKGQGPSPNESAYEHASDNAKFKRGDDWQKGHGKADDGELVDDDEDGHGKKHKEKDMDREKKKKGKQGDIESDDVKPDDGVEVDDSKDKGKKKKAQKNDDEPDDGTAAAAGKEKMKKSGKGKK